MKSWLRAALDGLVHAVVSVLEFGRLGRFLKDQFVVDVMERTTVVTYGEATLTFGVPNRLNRFRADTFASKAPETLEWITGMPAGAVLWDVGANVGLYSCLAARSRGCRVFAFEPSVFNLEMLARNIFLNKVTDLVTIVPLALAGGLGTNTLNMTTTEWGGALSTFGEDYGFDGRPMDKVFAFAPIGLSMDQAAEILALPMPQYLKIDVDGIEHLVLSGGAKVLQQVDSVLIEINVAFPEQAEQAHRYLTEARLSLVDQRRGPTLTGDAFEAVFNQIWRRPTAGPGHE